MRHFITLLFVVSLFASLTVAAEESCAIKSIKLLADGRIEQLSASFTNPTSIAAQLQDMSVKAGALSGIHIVSLPKFKDHYRISVGKANSAYHGAWVEASSKNLGLIQFHIAMSSPAKCELLALHLDFAK